MSRMLVIFGFVMLSQLTFGQDKKIDKIEILYDQGYYAKVVRKTNKMLANPEYDYSKLPSYYKSLALFRLAKDPHWFKRHNTAIKDAVAEYESFSEHSKYQDYVKAHYYEIASLKTYLNKLGKQMGELGYKSDAELIYDFNNKYLKSIIAKPDDHFVEPELSESGSDTNSKPSSNREKIVVYAKSFLGVKYVWAGSDKNGFDCSGFTSYVLKKFGIVVPRTASGQQNDARKVKTGNAQKGDLAFFGPGSKVTHVGMVVSNKGETLTMIHASSSKGVIITNIEESSYWKPKLKGTGTYMAN